MLTNPIYHAWIQRIRWLRPEQSIKQVHNFFWLIIGIYQRRSVCLSHIVGKMPCLTKLLSLTRHLSRFLSNPAIRVREWYEPIARQWLEAQFKHVGEIHLVVDSTKIGSGHQWIVI
jgi:hypothetical protein